MIKIAFTKMQGTGNDFVVIDGTKQPFEMNPERIQHLADRHRGVGFDQLLLVEPPTQQGADFLFRIYNADGSEVGQCGNGARGVARFIVDTGLSDKKTLVLETKERLLQAKLVSRSDVSVNMGAPILDPARIPFEAEKQALSYKLDVGHEVVEVGVVSFGNPHAVLVVPDVVEAAVQRLGGAIGGHPRFPVGANVGFMVLVDRRHIQLRVYERGVGETQACGSGACAAMAVGRLRGLLESKVCVHQPGGSLTVSWEGIGHDLWLTGAAKRVYQGVFEV